MQNKVIIDRPVSLKPVFHGACFEAVSAPTLYTPYPRRVRPPARIRRPGEDKARTKSAPKPLQNTLHGNGLYSKTDHNTETMSMCETMYAVPKVIL